MSLLLEALKRAEDDSRKRKLAAADALVLSPVDSPAAELTAAPPQPLNQLADTGLTLQDIEPQQETELTLQATPAQTPPMAEASLSAVAGTTEFPDLTTAFDSKADPSASTPAVVSAPLAGNLALHSHAKYARPDSASALQMSATPEMALGQTPLSIDTPESAPVTKAQVPIEPTFKAERSRPTSTPAASPMPMTTARQAKSAASVLAGQPIGKSKVKRTPEKRTVLLAIVAMVIGLPVVAFLFFGDQLLGSSTLVASVPTKPRAEQPVPANPAAATGVVEPALADASTTPAAITTTTVTNTTVVAAIPPVPQPLAVVARPVTRATTSGQPAPAPRTRGPANTARTTQDDGTPRSTVIDLDRPASTARAANSQGQPQQAAARTPPTSMEAAYAAYQSGNTQEATRLYRDVLRLDPTQRDAWLGLAVIAHNGNQREAAMDAYKRVLRLEPQNATALAGLTSLNNNADEPRQESRLRELLARSPQEADLNHSLALALSGERRWAEAQQLFFKAHTLAPQEPKFAYNLAVALDQLRKSTLAAQYYETALNLAQGKATSFDEARARTRLAALRASPAANPNINPPEGKTQ